MTVTASASASASSVWTQGIPAAANDAFAQLLAATQTIQGAAPDAAATPGQPAIPPANDSFALLQTMTAVPVMPPQDFVQADLLQDNTPQDTQPAAVPSLPDAPDISAAPVRMAVAENPQPGNRAAASQQDMPEADTATAPATEARAVEENTQAPETGKSTPVISDDTQNMADEKPVTASVPVAQPFVAARRKAAAQQAPDDKGRKPIVAPRTYDAGKVAERPAAVDTAGDIEDSSTPVPAARPATQSARRDAPRKEIAVPADAAVPVTTPVATAIAAVAITVPMETSRETIAGSPDGSEQRPGTASMTTPVPMADDGKTQPQHGRTDAPQDAPRADFAVPSDASIQPQSAVVAPAAPSTPVASSIPIAQTPRGAAQDAQDARAPVAAASDTRTPNRAPAATAKPAARKLQHGKAEARQDTPRRDTVDISAPDAAAMPIRTPAPVTVTTPVATTIAAAISAAPAVATQPAQDDTVAAPATAHPITAPVTASDDQDAAPDMAAATPDAAAARKTAPAKAPAANPAKTVKPAVDAPKFADSKSSTPMAVPADKPVQQAAAQPATVQQAQAQAPAASDNIAAAAPQPAAPSPQPAVPQIAPHVQVIAHAAPDVQALAVHIAARSQSGSRQFDIRLDPPELGRVDVRLSIDAGGKVAAHLSADQPQTLDLLQQDSTSLTQALRDAGLNVSPDSLNFSLRQQGDQKSSGSPARGRATALKAVASLEATKSSAPTRAFAEGRLDIRV